MPDQHGSSHPHGSVGGAHRHDHAGAGAGHVHGGHDHGSANGLADLLDLDAEVLRRYWDDALSWLRRVAGSAPRRILDLGAGTGTGTIALAQRFGGAEVTAVDAADGMLERIRTKALFLGLAERVHTVLADLDGDWPVAEPVDVTWASMSLHHLADPDRVLADLYRSTRPGGLLAVAEFAVQLRFLPDDLGFGRPGLEARCLELQRAEHAHSLPELGSDWAPRLGSAGFTVLEDRPFEIDLKPGRSAAAVDYARGWLGRLRGRFADRLVAEDRETLEVLLDGDGPESLRQRGDLRIRGTRSVTMARRP